MDISKEYIEMCEKSINIQELQKNFSDKLFASSRRVIRKREFTIGYHKKGNSKFNIWLPRQAQLQDLIQYYRKIEFKKFKDGWTWIIEGFNKRINDNSDYRKFEGESLEIVLLQLLVWQKFDKIWDGKDWV